MRRAIVLVAILLVAGFAGLVPPMTAVPPVEAAERTFVVNSTGDTPDGNPGDGRCLPALATVCTLRAAIQEANTTISRDAIAFNIPGPGVHTIRPASSLPVITTRLTIDGSTQPGASPNTRVKGTNAVVLIELDGSNTSPMAGLEIRAPNVVVAGLAINRFSKGVYAYGAAATGVLIEGCFLGTNAGGTQALGNGVGVFVENDAAVTIGGTTPAARNLISGNNASGIQLLQAGSGTVVQGDLIGTTNSGALDLGNGRAGVFVGVTDNVTIGGNDAAAANIIAFNGEDGVVVYLGISNRILRNSIFANGGEGIDLGADGRTSNDPLDADDGANHLQNWPALSAATRRDGVTMVRGRLRSSPNATFVVRVFSSPSGSEGQTFRGQFTVVTQADGSSPLFTFPSPTAIPLRHTVTATATDDAGNTSEFSRAVVVTAA